MAQRSKAHPENVPGPFFVDRTCIDCGTCFEFLPSVYREAGEHSSVRRQPEGEVERHRALMALLACPTGSIGTDAKDGMGAAQAAFPDPIEEDVSFCGWTSERSFGAWSYLIRRAGGNVLMDSPRAVPGLLKRLEALGGVHLMVLSHKDDVADHGIFHEKFHCPRVMHRGDMEGELASLELPQEGDDPVELAPDLLFIPTPGHTAGSACLLYGKKFLFSGDHLWWNPERGMLSASRAYCWHHWPTQLKSLERLLDHDFTWVLPGHGACHRADSPRAMRAELEVSRRHAEED
jgi:glyoxylase-like metal-dependent hydrolase (beta-lactamase superfamily II)/ferredoxin